MLVFVTPHLPPLLCVICCLALTEMLHLRPLIIALALLFLHTFKDATLSSVAFIFCSVHESFM